MKTHITYLLLLLCLVGCLDSKEELNRPNEPAMSEAFPDGISFDNLDLHFHNPPKLKVNVHQEDMAFIASGIADYIWGLSVDSVDDPFIKEDAFSLTFQNIGDYLYINYTDEELEKELKRHSIKK